VVAITSGILSKRWFKSPLIRLWKKYEQRQKVAEIFQIAMQLIMGKIPNSKPMLSFSAPLSVDELGGLDAAKGTILARLIEEARSLLARHPHC
jgi:hypothetical protein